MKPNLAWQNSLGFLKLMATGLLVMLGLDAREIHAQARGSFFLDVVDQETDNPLPFRAQVRNTREQLIRPRGASVVDGWSLVDGTLHCRGNPGDFTYRVFHGYEYETASGGFTVDKNAESSDRIVLKRHADLSSESWYAGDLASRIPAIETHRWLAAEGLRMAVSLSASDGEQLVAPEEIADQPVEQDAGQAEQAVEQDVKQTDQSGWVEHASYEHERGEHGGLVIHHWQPPTEVPADLPSARLLVAARDATVDHSLQSVARPGSTAHCEISRPWSPELPIWLASRRIDSFRLLGEHLTHDGERGLPVKLLVPFERRFPTQLARGMPPQRVSGMMVEQLYWQVLEAGLAIPPSAGSGFGKQGSPLGYNRVYAHSEVLTVDGWWSALRAGRSFVTNGPLLRVTINGRVPGHWFLPAAGDELELDVSVKLTVADPVQYLDVIHNGEKLYEARLDEFARQGGRIPLLKVTQSGWLLVRVVTERDHTYRLATTAPYYFKFGGEPRVSRAAVEYFRQWLQLAREEAERKGKTTAGAAAWEASQPFFDAAAKFWDKRLANANYN